MEKEKKICPGSPDSGLWSRGAKDVDFRLLPKPDENVMFKLN